MDFLEKIPKEFLEKSEKFLEIFSFLEKLLRKRGISVELTKLLPEETQEIFPEEFLNELPAEHIEENLQFFYKNTRRNSWMNCWMHS